MPWLCRSSNALSSVQANALAGVPPRLLVPLLQSCQFPIRIWLTLQAFTFYIYIRGGTAAVVPRRRCRQATESLRVTCCSSRQCLADVALSPCNTCCYCTCTIVCTHIHASYAFCRLSTEASPPARKTEDLTGGCRCHKVVGCVGGIGCGWGIIDLVLGWVNRSLD